MLLRSSEEGLKIEVEQSRGLIRELQERVQSDDRVEQLEASLQHVQNRASELEFQLSRSKQVCHLSFRISVIYISWWAGKCFTQS